MGVVVDADEVQVSLKLAAGSSSRRHYHSRFKRTDSRAWLDRGHGAHGLGVVTRQASSAEH